MSNEEIYVSCDIEANGKIPSDSSMLSLGAAAFSSDGQLLSTFSVNLETLPNAIADESTMNWWADNQEAYDATRVNTVDPKVGMQSFHDWLTKLDGKPVFVGYPLGYDFNWVYWYLIHFVGDSPFSFSGIDIKTYAMCMMKTGYKKANKRNMPKRWFPEDKHTHISVDDAIEQGKLFMNMLNENTANKPV